MPEKVKLPNGQVVLIPDDMTTDMRNSYVMSLYEQAATEVKEKKQAEIMDAPISTPTLPGLPPVRVKPSTIRGVMDVGGEVAGGTLGAIAATPLGPEAAIPAAGLGAIGGKKVSRGLQEKMGLNPQPYGFDEMLPDFAINAAGEGLGRIPFAAWRRAKALYRAGADTKVAKQNMDMLFDLGIDNPPLYMILEGADPKFDIRGLHDWASKNWFSANIMRDSAEKASKQANNQFYRMVRVHGAQGEALPDIEDIGAAFKSGVERAMPAWREVGNAKYASVFSRMPRDMPVSWENTKELLENRASLDPVISSLTTDKLGKVHRSLTNAYVEQFTKSLPEELTMEITRPMPFEQMQALRTQVGHKITSWEPGSDLPRKELKDLYGALTEDMKAAAEKVGVLDEFEDANKFWKENLDIQEALFDKINNKMKSDAEIGEAIQKFATRGGGQGDSQRLIQIREKFGGNSEEWGVIRNYLLKETGIDSTGDFSLQKFANKYNRLTDKAKQALIPDKSARESFDNFWEAAKKYGKDIGLDTSKSFTRMTRAEMLGPISGAMTLGALGGGLGWAATGSGVVGGAGGIAILGALSVITPRAAARLMTSQAFTRTATKAMGKTPEVVAGMISKLGANMATLKPDEQVALAEFFSAFGQLVAPPSAAPGKQQQRAPGVLGGQ
jgi:hypothetical protein